MRRWVGHVVSCDSCDVALLFFRSEERVFTLKSAFNSKEPVIFYSEEPVVFLLRRAPFLLAS